MIKSGKNIFGTYLVILRQKSRDFRIQNCTVMPRHSVRNWGSAPPAAASPTGDRTVSSGPNINSSSLNDMHKIATVVQQIVTGLNGAVSEEDKIVAVTKFILKLTKQSVHKTS
jgi:hypothetical protein